MFVFSTILFPEFRWGKLIGWKEMLYQASNNFPEEQLQEGFQTLFHGLIGFSVYLVFSFMTDKYLWILSLYDMFIFSIFTNKYYVDCFTSSVMWQMMAAFQNFFSQLKVKIWLRKAQEGAMCFEQVQRFVLWKRYFEDRYTFKGLWT